MRYSNEPQDTFPDLNSMEMQDRPREKLLTHGVEVMSDLELLVIMLGSGYRNKPVFSLASEILPVLDLNYCKPALSDLLGIKGLGPARLTSILAAHEFNRRRIGHFGIKITGPADVYRQVSHYGDRKQEHFLCLTLNGAGELIATRVVSIGLVNQSPAHPREVFADAITDRASSIIVAHNHPSGNLTPSADDINVTKRLQEAGELLKIPLLDHVIFSVKGYCGILSGAEGKLTR